MSRDIRSYFSTVSKKIVPKEKDVSKDNLSKATILNTSDIIPETPDDSKKRNKPTMKRKRIVVTLSSDSDSDKELKVLKHIKPSKVEARSTPPKEKVKSHLNVISKKFISPLEAFGSVPIQQDKIDLTMEPELNIHNDEDFEKTLLELDDDELLLKVAETNNGSTEVTKVAVAETASPKKVNLKKRKNDDGPDADAERHEKKRYSAMLYQQYLNRSGPAHLGSKWIPKGNANCLKGLCFIITGVLESLERNDAETLIKEHGGRCTSSVSSKVNYMVLGSDAGPAKVEKARKFGTKMISEDDLIDLICVKSGINNENIKPDTLSDEQSDTRKKQQTEKQKNVVETTDVKPKVIEVQLNKEIETKSKAVKIKEENMKQTEFVKPKNVSTTPIKQHLNSLTWVDKYKPTEVSQIIGQQGDRSNVAKLTHWLENWQTNRSREINKKGIARPSPWAKDDDGAFFRAALLSGSPGVGKTTTATLVCKQLGFDTVEFNASDTRNKKMVHNEVAQIIKSTSLAAFFNDGSAPSRKHALLMDEVDGMSGNEDRGGIQELIAIIKTSNIPIICMCNDRQHPKIRTLANYCFDLRFTKPRLEQIRGAMMSICYKEDIKLKPDVLTHIIQSTGQDVRQTLNQLALWSASSNNNSQQAQSFEKDVKLGPWEVVRKVFSEEEHKAMSLIDKSKLFFHDYSIGPLFIQENYVKVVPHCPKKEHLQRFANAADAISMGDVVDSRIRSTQNWALLDLQSMYASVLPGHYLEGHFGGQIDFPGWLGKNSKANKFQRMLSEINAHTRMSISGDRIGICLDYCRSLRDAIANPMVKNGSEGIQDSIAVMRAYNLLREDLTNLIELASWPKTKDPFEAIDSKIKAAFTRAYNKEAPILPYAAPGADTNKTKRGTIAVNDTDNLYNEYEVDEAADDSNNDENDITNDGMIKMKKTATSKGKTNTKSRGGSKRGAKK